MAEVGRKSKGETIRTGFKFEKDLYERFDRFCEENACNKTKLLEILMKKYLEEHNG